MFTGIVQGKFELGLVDMSRGYGKLGVRLSAELRESLKLGDSIAVDGVCLTVSDLSTDLVIVDVIKSTLDRTIALSYKVGDFVHIERSMTLESEIGGHEVSGHVDTFAYVERVERTEGNLCIFFRLEPKWARYVFPQGFVAISGASLTISDCLESGTLFSVWLIPETIRLTKLGDLQAGDRVNVEIHRGVQVVVDTIERCVDRFLARSLEGGMLDAITLQQLAQLRRLSGGDTGPAGGDDL